MQKNIKKVLISYGLILISFFFISILSYSVLIHTHDFMGFYDDPFHLKRILELKESFINKSFFPNMSFNQFHGSQIMTFYPYINLFPIAFISMFISSKILILYIWFTINTFISLLCGFYGCLSYIKSKKISYIFTLIYTTPVFFLCMGHGFNDFGVTTSCAVLPLAFFGCLNLIKNGKYIELSLGMTLLIYSHILDSLIVILFISLWIILNIFKLNKIKLFNFFKFILLTSLLTSIVWIPFFISIFKNLNMVSLPPSPSYISGGINPFKSFLVNYLSNSISIFSTIGALLAVIFYKKLSFTLKKLSFVAFIFLFVCAGFFIWNHVLPYIIIKLISRLQYISRICIIPQVILSYVFTIILFKYILIRIKNVHFYRISILFFIIVIVLLQIYNQKDLENKWLNSPIITSSYQLPKDDQGINKPIQPYRIKRPQNFKYLLISSNEFTNYFPKKSLKNSDNILHYNAITHNRRIHIKKIGFNTFAFKSNQRMHYLLLPFVGYKGTNLSIELNHHKMRHVDIKNGQILIYNVPKGNIIFKINSYPNKIIIYIKLLLFILGLVWILKNIVYDVI